MDKKNTIITILILLVGFLSSTSTAIAQIEKPQKVTLRNTELRTIKSSFVNQNYQLQIFLPPVYSDSSRSFPVLYLLDADKSFGMAKDIVDWLIFGREVPPIIVVGISYGEGTKQWWQKRSRDYTPSKDRTKVWGDWPQAGGAADFKKFIKLELIPFIDKTYRTSKSDRAIAGLSFGGLFATYVLFSEPELFSKYIISGPALLWDDKIVFKHEEEYAKTHDSLHATVFSSVGELDDQEKIIKPWEEFDRIIEQRNYKGLSLSNVLIKGQTHLSAWPVSFTIGIKSVHRSSKP